MPESRDEHAHKSFDVAGAVTVTGGLIALVYGIVRSAESGWGSGEVLGILARRRRPARRLRRDRAALGRAARPALDLLGAHGARRQRRDARRRVRPVRDVLLQHAVRAARARLLAARGRARVPPVHGRDHHRLGRLAAADPAARRARGSA